MLRTPRPDARRVSTLTTRGELEGLAGEWDALVAGMPRPSPFLLHGWVSAWARHHLVDGALRVVVARRGGRLVGALPLCVRRRHGLRVLEFLGGSQSALGDALLAPDEPQETVGLLVDDSRRWGHDYADLFGLPGESRLATVAGPERLTTIERVEAPVLDLAAGWDAVYRSKTTSKKRNLHARRRRQLAEVGRVSSAVARTEGELAAALEAAFELHRLRWAGRPDGSGFGSQQGMRFHRDAVGALAPLGIPRIVVLRVDDQPVAFHYYLLYERRMYVHRLAFDPRYARVSPGLLATLDAIAAAAEEGAERIEFLGGDERYKMELADDVEPLHQGLGLACGAAGRAVVEARLGSIAVRRRLKRSPTLRRVYFDGLAPARRAVARIAR